MGLQAARHADVATDDGRGLGDYLSPRLRPRQPRSGTGGTRRSAPSRRTRTSRGSPLPQNRRSTCRCRSSHRQTRNPPSGQVRRLRKAPPRLASSLCTSVAKERQPLAPLSQPRRSATPRTAGLSSAGAVPAKPSTGCEERLTIPRRHPPRWIQRPLERLLLAHEFVPALRAPPLRCRMRDLAALAIELVVAVVKVPSLAGEDRRTRACLSSPLSSAKESSSKHAQISTPSRPRAYGGDSSKLPSSSSSAAVTCSRSSNRFPARNPSTAAVRSAASSHWVTPPLSRRRRKSDGVRGSRRRFRCESRRSVTGPPNARRSPRGGRL